MATPSHRLAVLIDADNTSPVYAAPLLEELARYGVPTVKRAYGDWTTQQLSSWKDVMPRHAIQPMQQFAHTRGKNSTDSALIIDAMDLLYAGHLDAFALVSSDSDFTRLATRLRESGKTVYGLGRRSTPTALIAACDRFIFLEVLTQNGPRGAAPDELDDLENDVEDAPLPDLRTMLTSAISNTAHDDGWAGLGAVGQFISTQHASFDARSYGYARLGLLVADQDYLDVETRDGILMVRSRSGRASRTRKATGQKAAGQKAPTQKAAAKKAAAKKTTAKKATPKKSDAG